MNIQFRSRAEVYSLIKQILRYDFLPILPMNYYSLLILKRFFSSLKKT